MTDQTRTPIQDIPNIQNIRDSQDTRNTQDLQAIKAEIRKTYQEPLLPVEKKLIGWSLGTGIVLLVLLVVLSRFFPVGT
ncbi:MAG: hypothetical protein V4505_09615 [Pseudomonadota bacterium]